MADEKETDLIQGLQDNQEEIYGGEIRQLDEDMPRFDEAKHRAQTASRLAYILVFILAVGVAGHYVSIICLGNGGSSGTVQLLDSAFDRWLPVLSGFVGGAVTYYFTREKR